MNDVALVGTSPDLTEAVCKLNNVPYFIFQKNSKTSDKPIWLQRLQMKDCEFYLMIFIMGVLRLFPTRMQYAL